MRVDHPIARMGSAWPQRTALAVAVVLSLASTSATGQTSRNAPKPWSPPRTSDGQPDIQGIWSLQRGTPPFPQSIEEGAEPRQTVLASNEFLRGSAIVDPPDGKVPYQPWAAAKKKARFDRIYDPDPAGRDPVSTRCVLAGLPRMQYQTGFRILQVPGHVVILFEFQHAYRVIPLDGRPHPPANVKLWMGDSRGRWEGNTLRVEVTNHHDTPWLDWAGNFHSDALRMVERWTFVGAGRINYEATMEDPKVYTRPWKIALTYVRNEQEDYEQQEDSCYEGTAADAGRYAPGHNAPAPTPP
jgi:hypothetical protein